MRDGTLHRGKLEDDIFPFLACSYSTTPWLLRTHLAFSCTNHHNPLVVAPFHFCSSSSILSTSPVSSPTPRASTPGSNHLVMAGDHKCPVCSSTFTRPQHVARHMRSHTGDRPYKCQHCGDQFARSDLLSRHVNKCHASEKPPTTTAPNNRRKGTAAASRATTSKQACDQCVTSSLPCDGCNPCSKCVQRKCRCTYVKFHRQTAPAGPGHLPPNAISQNPHRSSVSLSSRVPDDFLLGPAPAANALGNVIPGMYLPDYAGSVYSTSAYDPRQPSSSQPLAIPSVSRDMLDTSPDMMARYRAQAALLSRANVLPQGAINAPGLSNGPLYPGSSQISRYASGVGVDDYGRPFPGGGGSAALAAHPQSHGSASGFSNLPSQSQHSYSAAAGGSIPFPQSHSGPSPPQLHRSGNGHPSRSEERSDDFGSDTHSLTSSKNSSSVSLSIDQHGSGRVFPPQGYQSQHQRKDEVGEGGFSSAFGLMSLDDPAVLAGLANDSEPFFSVLNTTNSYSADSNQHAHPHMRTSSSTTSLSEASMTSTGASSHTSSSSVGNASNDTSSSNSQSELSLQTPTPDLIASLKNGGILSAGGRDILDSRELREFWKQYMRTPLTGPGSGNVMFSLQTPTGPGQQLGSTSPQSRPSPSRRHSRVASLPSMKTPPIFTSNYANSGATAHLQESGSFAASSNFTFSSQPKAKHRAQSQDQGRGQDGPSAKLQYSSVRTTLHGDAEDLKSYEQAVLARKAPTTLNLVPKRRGTLPLGTVAPNKASGPGGVPIGSLSQAPSLPAPPSDARSRIGSGNANSERPGSSSSSLADAFGIPRTFQQQNPYHSHSSESPPGLRESSVGAESDSGLSSSPSQSYRPSFKRLASQTLGPPNTKRALLGPAGWDDRETSEEVFDEEEEFRGYRSGGLGLEATYTSRRYSLPAGQASGGAGGMTLPPIRTASEKAETRA
ncbi:hypothetical protein BDY19DRAFT_938969 [Irpex rosettiformis]|uniref:Uncharacterized protein n=1 Tax=Irpex rosettiformis TaxID=378272 RepID=A0ACB8U7J2_9APHY|nr:hypothetical protein BDY19DRAFT_938969 [Irpex rosettiformis]